MKKGNIIEFIKELVCYLIIIVILLFIASKLGWTNSPVLETSIELTIGWVIWKLIMMIINKNKK